MTLDILYCMKFLVILLKKTKFCFLKKKDMKIYFLWESYC